MPGRAVDGFTRFSRFLRTGSKSRFMALALPQAFREAMKERSARLCGNPSPLWRKVRASLWSGHQPKEKAIGLIISPQGGRRQKCGHRNRESPQPKNCWRHSLRRHRPRLRHVGRNTLCQVLVVLLALAVLVNPDPELEFVGRWPSRTGYRRCLCSLRSHPSQYEGGRNRQSVAVSDYQQVHKGNLVVALEDSDFQAQVSQARQLQDARIYKALRNCWPCVPNPIE